MRDFRLVVDFVGEVTDANDWGFWQGLCSECGPIHQAEGWMAPEHDDVVAALTEHALWDHGTFLELEARDWLTSHAAPEFMERTCLS